MFVLLTAPELGTSANSVRRFAKSFEKLLVVDGSSKSVFYLYGRSSFPHYFCGVNFSKSYLSDPGLVNIALDLKICLNQL